MRVVLMSKRFERLQAARARAMERASRPTRAAASSVSARSGAATASTASEDDGCRRAPSRGSSSRRPDLHRGRDAPARWWEVPDASETDRRGDAPEAATREGGETANDGRCASRKKTKKTSQRSFSRPAPADDGTKRDDDDDDARSPAPPRARGRSIFFSSRHRRENLQKSRKRAARVLASRRGHRRAPARASQGEVRGGGVRLGAQPSRNARENGDVHKKHILRRSASGASPPAWRSRSAPRAAGETTASPSRPLVPRRGATGRGGAGTRERPRAFWGKARDASSRRRRLRQPPFPKTEYWSLCRALGAATRGTATGRASSRTGRVTANCARVCGVRSRRATET